MRLLKRAGALLALAMTVLVTSAHIGSPDTYFQGTAGPYPVRVVVRLPGVIPGLGQIDITVDGDDVQRVTAQPVIYNAGPEGAPPADDAVRVPGQTGTWHAELWFMTQASFSVKVGVDGARGEGTVTVPVAAVAIRQVGLYPWLAKLMAVLGGILFIGAITIVRAAATDAVVAPGAQPTKSARGLVATAAAVLLLLAAGFGGRAWWNRVEQEYLGSLYRPKPATAIVDTAGGRRVLAFTVTDSNWITQRGSGRSVSSPLVPDHGKLMHLFLVQRADSTNPASGFAHLHPVSTDTVAFTAPIGQLPAGLYDAYADVTHESGFTETLVATVTVPAPLPGDSTVSRDADDVTASIRPVDSRIAFADGGNVTWERPDGELIANADAQLRFVVRDAAGSIAQLEPYLGMAGHAVVQRTDGSVYIHLHPNGTISAAAQQALEQRLPSDSVPGTLARRLGADGGIAGMAGMAGMHHPTFDGTLTFPYAFPEPGAYRIWIQFRRGGVIQTAAFQVQVRAAGTSSTSP